MTLEIKVPSPGESISEVQLASWLVKDGDFVDKDQEIAEIDSDKATLTINAEEHGIIKILVEEGNSIEVGSVIATLDVKEARIDKSEKPAKKEEKPEKTEKKKEESESGAYDSREEAKPDENTTSLNISPVAKKLMNEKNVTEEELLEFFKTVRFSKKDIEFFLENRDSAGVVNPGTKTMRTPTVPRGSRDIERQKLSTLRLKIAERLVAVRNDTAMLTTFNEVNMSPVMNIRKQYKDIFKEKHGISLGFMSFFTKAASEALQLFPSVNAMMDGKEIIYHRYTDIGIAVSTPKGLMVPVLKNVEDMGFADIELRIKELAGKARDNKISLDEMKGGTFTITNGGVFGSMLSTPIINPPQTAILGMHNIVERPVAVDGKVEIHPVMYVALSYDHRIIDGRDSVGFLVKVKEMLENPVKMLFGGMDPVQNLLGL